MIEAGEYRFISPVFTFDRSGRVTRLLHAALCDVSVDEMNALPLSVINQVKAAAALNADFFALRGRIIAAARALAPAGSAATPMPLS